MITKEARRITQEEFEAILKKMKFYNMNEGYIGEVKGKMEIFLFPCSKANALITKSEVEEAIERYNKGEV